METCWICKEDLEPEKFPPEPLLAECRHPVCIVCARNVTDYSCKACNKPWDVRIFAIAVSKYQVVCEHYGRRILRSGGNLTIYGYGEPKRYKLPKTGLPHEIPYKIVKALAPIFLSWDNFEENLDNMCRSPMPGCAFIAFHNEPEYVFFVALCKDGKTLVPNANVVVISHNTGPYEICVKDGLISHPMTPKGVIKTRIDIETHIALLKFVAENDGQWDKLEKRETIHTVSGCASTVSYLPTLRFTARDSGSILLGSPR